MASLLGSALMAALQLPLGAASPQNVPETTPTLLDLPTVVPTIYDPHAPDPQKECPGYRASNIVNTHFGFSADLDLAGPPCDVFGKDVLNLTVSVSYQTKERLNVKIVPRFLDSANSSRHILDDQFVQLPQHDGFSSGKTSDLSVQWSNDPTFQFSVSRRENEEEIFSTFGHIIVFEDQYLELKTNMVEDYNVYGLAEIVRNFRFGTNFTATLFNVDSANAIDRNSYSSHPFYQETRYHRDKPSSAHGVYARNAHGQEWLMRDTTITYRTIGGSFDFYFLSGEASTKPTQATKRNQATALEVIRQYQQCIGFPAMQMYWTLGFHQCHWGWNRIQNLQDVVDNYAKANIPLEAIWTDIDVYYRYRPLTNDPDRFPSKGMHDFVAGLRENGQHYVPLVDSNVYYPSENESFPPFERGDELGAFIRDRTGKDYFVGKAWPGNSVWADWHVPSSQKWFTNELKLMDEATPFDGIWIDLNEPSNFNNVLANKMKRQSLVERADITESIASNDTRKLNFPPYRINNARSTNQIIDGTIPFDALHNDIPATREYDAHNLWSLGVTRAAYNAISSTVHPGKRPFIVTRSTFIGHGRYGGHWGGDNASKWGAMFLSISQALTMSMAGIPMFGTDTCGFAGKAEEELCARWFQLNAFFPFYRNHYGIGEPAQEAYVWPSVADSTRLVLAVRYSLLTYIYTLLHLAHTEGSTILRALAWEFPNDASLRSCDTQFLLGPSLLITPVLEPGARTVRGVFPGIGNGERWYDTHSKLEVKGVRKGENVTMEAPLERINVHVRGGSVLALQEPGNTTAMTRQGAYSLLIALDEREEAVGSLYLDDGENIVQEKTKMVGFTFSSGVLGVSLTGVYETTPPLANVTILGWKRKVEYVSLSFDQGKDRHDLRKYTFRNETLTVTGMEEYFKGGAWEREFRIKFD